MGHSVINTLKQMRNWNKPIPIPPQPPPFNLDLLRQTVAKDQGITGSQKDSVLQSLADPEFVGEIRSGAVGAALMYLITKYLKLSPQTQLLLSIAGFGIGKIIYDYKHNPSNFASYNSKLKMYEIK